MHLKDFAAYHFFASSLISLRPSLSKLKCFGTDGEDALVKAFSTAFSDAFHLRCFLHFRGNVEEKLRELRVPSVVAKAFVHDILGNPAQLELGLVDAEGEGELDAMLASLEVVWNRREQPYNYPPQFSAWFLKYCRQTVAENMIRPVRERALLGSPPQPYYTNEVESKNNVLKQHLKYKASELPQFVENMKKLLTEQRREVERAVATTGEYRLSPNYGHLAVSPQKWFTQNEQQRQRCIKRFLKAKVCIDLPIHGREDGQLLSEDEEQPSSEVNPLHSLRIPADVKDTLWKKGQSLAEDEAAMVRSPGSSTDWIIRSSTGKQPHFVKPTSKGGLACDSSCLAYKSMRICSHTVAVAVKADSVQQLVGWHRKSKFTANLTCVAEEGKPSGVGKKAHRKASSKAATKRIRKIVAQAQEEDFSKRVVGSQSPGNLSGVAIGRRSKVHIEHLKQSLKVVTTSPSAQPLTTPHHVGTGQVSSAATGIAVPNVPATLQSTFRVVPNMITGQLTSLVSCTGTAELGSVVPKGATVQPLTSASLQPNIAFGYTASNPPIAPTLLPSQFVISSTPPVPTGYQLPDRLFLGSPPPLVPISASADSRPAVGDPFMLCFVQGNISRCNGCKGRICRGEDRKPLPPPDDIVLRHMEFVIFQNPNTGAFQQTRTPRNVYYHAQKTCVAPHFLQFNPMQHIVIDSSISHRLTEEHRMHLKVEFGLDLV